MIKIELFTKFYEAEYVVEDDQLIIKLLPEAKKDLEDYLRIVLKHYVLMPNEEESLTFEDLVEIASAWEKQNPDKRLEEPVVLLPYEVPEDVKKMLADIAQKKGISMTQVVIEMIDNEYDEVMPDGK